MELKLIHDYTTGIEGELEAQARLTLKQVVMMFDEGNKYPANQTIGMRLNTYGRIIESLRQASRE